MMFEREYVGIITVVLCAENELAAQQHIEKLIDDSDCNLKKSMVFEYESPFNIIEYEPVEKEE